MARRRYSTEQIVVAWPAPLQRIAPSPVQSVSTRLFVSSRTKRLGSKKRAIEWRRLWITTTDAVISGTMQALSIQKIMSLVIWDETLRDKSTEVVVADPLKNKVDGREVWSVPTSARLRLLREPLINYAFRENMRWLSKKSSAGVRKIVDTMIAQVDTAGENTWPAHIAELQDSAASLMAWDEAECAAGRSDPAARELAPLFAPLADDAEAIEILICAAQMSLKPTPQNGLVAPESGDLTASFDLPQAIANGIKWFNERAAETWLPTCAVIKWLSGKGRPTGTSFRRSRRGNDKTVGVVIVTQQRPIRQYIKNRAATYIDGEGYTGNVEHDQALYARGSVPWRCDALTWLDDLRDELTAVIEKVSAAMTQPVKIALDGRRVMVDGDTLADTLTSHFSKPFIAPDDRQKVPPLFMHPYLLSNVSACVSDLGLC